jgi:hypothetical protein
MRLCWPLALLLLLHLWTNCCCPRALSQQTPLLPSTWLPLPLRVLL